ncbi:MAG: LysR family transcriptional regulator [Acidobacteriaceae bacterium]|nr:LysR family transcriptional regulator [Acidobacteriaceae bacterium]
MEFAHSRALIAIGELGGFGKAGERLHLSPPAVFAQIHQLEQEFGEKLYERSGRKLVLTPAGRLLLEYCRRLVRVHDEAVGAVRELSGVQCGSLYLGCGPHISVSIVPHLIHAYVSKYPNMQLRLITGNDQMLFEDLYAGKVDLIIMNLPADEPTFPPDGRVLTDDPDLVRDPLWRYELVFVVPPDYPTRRCGTASVDELSAKPFILYQRSVVIESAIRRFCTEVAFEPKIVMQNDQADSIKELVKLGVGISLLPLWSVSEDLRRGALKIVRLHERQLFSITGLIYRRSSHLPVALRSLVAVAHEWKSWLPKAADVQSIKH